MSANLLQAANQQAANRPLIIVPTLNESRHIAPLLDLLISEAQLLGGQVVVADGGSSDGTQEIVRRYAERHDCVVLLHNPKRIQSAAMNLGVATFGDDFTYAIRVDAHGSYPEDYCRALIAEADRTHADSIVVPLRTVGQNTFQRAVATAQNSLVGTGGSPHRTGKGKTGRWVEHGHHALMRIAAYRAVDGYDEGFRQNEDAEMDYRLGRAGFRIWLTGATHMVYYPRATPAALFKQYLGYGRGRARNIFKHRSLPRARQAMPVMIAPAIGVAGLSVLYWPAILPVSLWLLACLSLGTVATRKANYGLSVSGAPLVAATAMIMHLAWSMGFWLHVAESLFNWRRRA